MRFTLASMASPGTDIAFNVARTEGYRAFANKIWNAARFIFMNVDRAAEIGIAVDPAALGGMPIVAADAPLEARWIVAELQETAAKVNKALENYRFDDAANTIYQFFWGSFCDWYLEIVKLRLDFSETADKAQTKAALTTLVSVFEAALRLLSPFMPFLTEELWHAVYDGNQPAKSIALAQYPYGVETPMNTLITVQMHLLQDLVRAIREFRKDLGVPEKEFVPAYYVGAPLHPDNKYSGNENEDLISQNESTVKALAKVSSLIRTGGPNDPACAHMNLTFRDSGTFEIAIVYEKQIDVAAERERLNKEFEKVDKVIANAERQLNNPGFTTKAPPHIVEGLKKQLDEARRWRDKLGGDLDRLPG